MEKARMKKRSWFAMICIAMMLLSAFLLTACKGDPTPDPVKPVEKAGTQTSFSLDLNGNPEKTVTISDYIDENGATGVTYSTRSARSKNVAVTQPSDGTFKITVLEAHTSAVAVYLEANQGGKVELEIAFSIQALDTRPRYTISGIEDGFGYQLVAEDTVLEGEPYSFVIQRLYGFRGAPTFNYEIGGEPGEPLTPVENPAGKFTYTIAADKMNDMEFIKSGAVLVSGFKYDTLEDAVPLMSEDFFIASNWSGGSGDQVAQEGDKIVFTNSLRRISQSVTPAGLYANVPEDVGGTSVQKWPNADKSDVGPYTYSFSVKAQGGFTLGFLSSGAATPNELQLRYDGNGFELGRSVGGNLATFGTAPNSETGFEDGKEYRLDLVVTATLKKIGSAGLESLAVGDPESGLIKMTLYLDGEKVIFKNGGKDTVSNVGTSGHHFRLEKGDAYIQRLNLPGSPSRYNNFVSFYTNTAAAVKNGGTVTIGRAPVMGDRYDVINATRSGAGYTMSGLAAAYQNSDYTLTVVRDELYKGTPAIATTIGGVAYTLPVPTETNGTFVFVIPGEDVAGDIEFGEVTGIAQYKFSAVLPEDAGYDITGATEFAETDVDYEFTLTIWKGYSANAGFKVAFSIGGAAEEYAAITGSASPYTVTIPGTALTDNLEIFVYGVEQDVATYNITDMANGTGYILAGDPTVTVPDDGSYVFTVTLEPGYKVLGELTLEITIDGKVITLTGVETASDSGVYTLEIAKDLIIDDIIVGGVTGVIAGYDVSGITSGTGFIMAGDDKAYGGSDYLFTVFVTNPATILVPTYQIGGGAVVPAELVSSSADGRSYVFMVPQEAYVFGEAVTIGYDFADGSGISQKSANLTVDGLVREGTFDFADLIDPNVKIVTYEAELISGGVEELESTVNSFTVKFGDTARAGESAVIRIWVLENGSRIYKQDVLVTLMFKVENDQYASGADSNAKDADNLFAGSSEIFNPNAWQNVPDATRNAKPTVQPDGSLKFENTTQRVYGATFTAGDSYLESKRNPEEPEDPSAGNEVIDTYTYSLMFLSPDDEFTIRFFASGGEGEQLTVSANGTANPNQSGNSYSLTYSQGRFAYYATLGGGTAYTKPYYFSPAGYEAGKWNRFDFVFSTVMDDLGGGAGAYKKEYGTIETRVHINGVFQGMETEAGESTDAVHVATANRVSKLTDGVPSHMRCSGTGGLTNYSNIMMIQTKLNGSVSIAPASGWKASEETAVYNNEVTVYDLSAPSITADTLTGSYVGAVDGSDIAANVVFDYRYGNLTDGYFYTRAFKVNQLSGTPTPNVQLFTDGGNGLYWDVLGNLAAIGEQDATDEMTFFAENARTSGYAGYLGDGEEFLTGSIPVGGDFMFYADEPGEYVLTCDVLELFEDGFAVRGSYRVLVTVADVSAATAVTVTPPAADAGYTFVSGDAYEGIDYTFSIVVNNGFTVPDGMEVEVTIGSQEPSTLSAVKVSGNRYIFVIDGTLIDDDIVINSVNGIKEVFTVDLTTLEGEESFTIAGAETVLEDADYIFTVALTEGYIVVGDLTVDYTMGGNPDTATGVLNEGTYVFTIASVSGNIVLTAIDGIENQGSYNVTDATGGAGDEGVYSITYDVEALQGVDHIVTIVLEEADQFPVLTYTIDSTIKTAVFESVSADHLTYVFLIPSEDFVYGMDIELAVEMNQDNGGLALVDPAPTADDLTSREKEVTFDFADFIDTASATGEVTYFVYIGEGTATVNSEQDSFTLAATKVGTYNVYILVFVDGAPTMRHTITVTIKSPPPAGDDISALLFAPNAWRQFGGTSDDPSGSMTAGTDGEFNLAAGQKARANIFDKTLVVNNGGALNVTGGGNGSVLGSGWQTDVPTQRISFDLKASGDFALGICAIGAGDNRINLAYSGGTFTLGRYMTNSGTTVGTATAEAAGYTANEWNTIDIVVTAVQQFADANGLINEPVTGRGMIKVQIYINGELVLFESGGETTKTVNSGGGNTIRIEDGSSYIQRVNDSANSTRFGSNFSITDSASGLSIKPIATVEA